MTTCRKRILIVDDENLIRWSLCMTLQGEDFEVHLAESAEEAMELTKEIDFDLIITDYRLENIDGLRFAERVKTLSPDTKIFILTAYGTKDLRLKAKEVGVEAFIDKPFDMSLLTKVVKKHLCAPGRGDSVYS